MLKCRFILPLVLVLLLFSQLSSQLRAQSNLNFDVLSIDDGFSSSRANVIMQDRAGFIWVGTWNGLNRYDGYECVVFQSDHRDPTALSNREITALLEDHKGNIWIGTTFGLNRYNPVLDHLQKYHFETRILSLYEDANNKIWVGTAGDGLYRLDPESGTKHHYLAGENINDIYEDKRNEFWLATSSGPVNFDRASSSYRRYLNHWPLSPAEQVPFEAMSMAGSADGSLWIGMAPYGIMKIISHENRDSIKLVHYQPGEQAIGGLCRYPVDQLLFDQQNNLWIGTRGGGLLLLTAHEQEKQPARAVYAAYHYDVNDRFSFDGDNTISALFIDRNETLWVGSSHINIAKIGSQNITRFNTRQINSGEVTGNWVMDIGVDHDGYTWLGTSDGLIRYDAALKPYQRIISSAYRHKNKIKNWSSIHSLIALNEDQLLVGTASDGLVLCSNSIGNDGIVHAEAIFDRNSSPALPENGITVLAPSVSDSSVIWVGTAENGLVKCDFSKGKPSFVNYRSGYGLRSMSDNHVRCIIEDRYGKVWVGTQYGLNCFNPENETFERYFFSDNDSCSLNDNVINVLYEDRSGMLWVGTNSGLNRKRESPSGGTSSKCSFQAFPDQTLVDNQIILNILEDDHQNLWVGIYNGIVKFNTLNHQVDFEYFDKAYSRIKIDQNSSWKDEQGRFLLGGGNGFLRFHPDSIRQQSRPPMIQLTDLLLFNRKAKVDQQKKEHRLLDKTISYTDSLVFSHQMGVFTFVFSAMEYYSSSEHKYAYVLDGYDKDWNYVGARNTATYTNIPAGKYTFRVKACNSHGVWSSEPRAVFLQIKPPFWKSYWAYLLYAVMITGLLYFFNQFSIIQIREKSRLLLERVQYEKEHELNELKVHFFTNITHEFRTPLTLILGPLQEMLEQKAKFGVHARNLELIQRNAHRLLRLINQLMEFRKVEKGKVELLLQEVDVVPVLIEMYDSFKSLADSKNIDFMLHYEQPTILAWLDRDKFDKVLFNLLSNAFKFTDEGGRIDIRSGIIHEEHGVSQLFIEVDDSGIGIPPEKTELVFERFYQVNQRDSQSTGGIGLYLSKNFIELHRGSIRVVSEPDKGSCFKITLPVNLNQQHDMKLISTVSKGTQGNEQPFDENSFEAGADDRELTRPQGNEENSFQLSGTSDRPLVLLVEDDLDMNEFIGRGLAAQYRIKSAFNGKEALQLARRLNPDLILSDIMMPEMDGLEMGHNLQNDINTSHIPLLFLTAKTNRENELEGLQAGAVDYISKPFSMASLIMKVSNILKTRDLLRERFQKSSLLEPEVEQLSSLDEEFLKKVMEVFNNNIDNSEFDVERMSRELGISANQTYRKIKALTGQTAKEFIRTQRLKCAAKLLIQKKRSVSEVIYMVGFTNPSYFSRCFKEFYQCTPTEYIERYGENA
jgi:signal transduction histidine kinase/ligand-binding sensor domain-containing protein/DNA-binding response OmpR family regulator